ncbi:MAG: low molecular weight phosphotyrosine protein phosphatase [Oscillospiraceae bacterium]|nr:low molecular weight phosphotyrosine protein phosphatase [Oscillospiraceae bacterium]
MIRILFVCLGNICRSPMAEFVMKDLAAREAPELELYIESGATCSDEIGNPVYPPVRKLLNARGIDCSGKTARQITRADYDRFDYIIGMEGSNMRNMLRIFGGDPAHKLSLLLDHTDRPGDVADPYYTLDFTATERDVDRGCAGLLRELRK